jgi:hypothetical protein
MSAVALIVAVGALSAARTAQAQLVTVSLKSADELLTQFRAIAASFDAANAQKILAALDLLKNDDVLKGLDRTKPIAATLELVPAPQAGPVGIPRAALFVPVTDQAAFLKALAQLGLGIDDAPGVAGFSHKLSVGGPQAPPLLVLASPPSGYLVVTNAPMEPEKLRSVKPAALVSPKAGLLFANVRIDRIPDPVREMFLANVKQQNDRLRKRNPGEDEIAYKSRMAAQSLMEDAVNHLLVDGQEFALNLNVDTTKNRFSLSLEADAKPGTPMAGSLASYAARSSRFHGLVPGALLNLGGILPLNDMIRDIFRTGIAADRERAKQEKDAAARRLITHVIDAVEPTLLGESLDAFMVLDVPPPGAENKEKGGPNVMLFGFALKDSKKLEGTLRDAAANNPDLKKKEDVSFDHDRADDGTAIHKLKVEGKDLEAGGFGESFVYLAFPDGAVLASVGAQGLPILKNGLKALKNRAATARKGEPQIDLDVATAGFARMYRDQPPSTSQLREIAGATFSGKDAGKDHVDLGLFVEPTAARLALEADLAVLRFFAEVGSRVN